MSSLPMLEAATSTCETLGQTGGCVLAPRLMSWGAEEAQRRLNRDRGPRHRDVIPSPKEDAAVRECESVRAEVVGMVWTNAPLVFPRRPTHDVPDVLPDIEIRHRLPEKSPLLIIRPGRDDLSRRFVLVTGRGPRFVLRGWLWGTEAEAHPLSDPGRWGRAWFIHERFLRPMMTLAKYGERQR